MVLSIITYKNYYVRSPTVTYVTLWDSSIPYWLIANGRRFILVAKVSTTYPLLTADLLMPLHDRVPVLIVCMGKKSATIEFSFDEALMIVSMNFSGF